MHSSLERISENCVPLPIEAHSGIPCRIDALFSSKDAGCEAVVLEVGKVLANFVSWSAMNSTKWLPISVF